jgi:hypothetical protein
VSGGTRALVGGLVLLGLLGGVALVAFAASACPARLPGQPCPEAGTNRAVVVGLAAVSGGLLACAFAFLGEFALRRRIVYRGAWSRAVRRGLLVAVIVAAVAGLRLGNAFTPASAGLVLLLAAALEWSAVRRLDGR